MTLSHVGTANLTGSAARRASHAQHQVGDPVNLKVVRRLNGNHYLISFRDAQRVVNSTVPLTVGSTVRATVTAVGEKLELRYVSTDNVAAAMEDHEAANEDSLADFAARYSVELGDEHRLTIQHAMLSADDPAAMASGGVFLSKLALPVDTASLNAVYAAQTWGRAAAEDTAAVDLDSLLRNPIGSPQSLAALIGKALDDGGSQVESSTPGREPAVMASLPGEAKTGATDTQTGEDGDWRELAHELLNEQDDSSLAYRYGVLPVLIADELVELDLVHFRERRQDGHAADSRRLVMTFKTATLGRVEIVARALDDRLSIAINTDSALSKETLAARSAEVLELLTRLGWNVETVAYEVGAADHRAARHVLDHVLSADTLSRLV